MTWAGVISGLSKQSRRGAPCAQQAYQLWKQLESSGLHTGNASAHAAGGRPAHSLILYLLQERLHRDVLCLSLVRFAVIQQGVQ